MWRPYSEVNYADEIEWSKLVGSLDVRVRRNWVLPKIRVLPQNPVNILDVVVF